MRLLCATLLVVLFPQQEKKAFTAELIGKVKANVLSLHSWYVDKAIGEEVRRRLEAFVADGKGTAEDAAWLESISRTTALDTAKEELAAVVKKIGDLEGGITDDLPVDRLVMQDGRTIDCKILEQTATEVKIERKLSGGVGGKMNFKMEQVKEIHKGKGAGSEFANKLAAAKAVGSPGLVALADWCKEQSLTKQRDYALWLAIRADPGNATTRTALGLGRTPDEKPATKSGKIVAFDGKDWDALELKTKLLKDGNVLIIGQWYKPKDRMLTIPGLFKYEKQEKKQLSVGGDLPMVANYVLSYKSVYSATSKSYTEEKTKGYTHRFFAPEMNIETREVKRDVGGEKETWWLEDEPNPKAGTAMSGEIKIPIAVDMPVLSAKVIAYAEIDQGTVTCFVDSANGGRVQVYQASKKDTGSHELPTASVKNLQSFDVIFKVDTVAAYVTKDETRKIAALKKGKDNVVEQKEIEVRHKKATLDYKVRLFASNSNQVEVFRVTLTCGEAAPNWTKAFEEAGCGDLLK